MFNEFNWQQSTDQHLICCRIFHNSNLSRPFSPVSGIKIPRQDCPQSICHFCGQIGHLARQCHFGQSLEIGPGSWQDIFWTHLSLVGSVCEGNEVCLNLWESKKNRIEVIRKFYRPFMVSKMCIICFNIFQASLGFSSLLGPWCGGQVLKRHGT